jgi:regulator of protease activity HflC (stomatin/prohibitin superfamily)
MRIVVFALVVVLGGAACGSADVPQTHRGQLFDRTGAGALYLGGHGFTGPVLEPGTYYTGLYDEVRTVECSTVTVREDLASLTRDGVQFGVDVYVRVRANCTDDIVKELVRSVPPDEPQELPRSISANKLYATFVRPALGASVRETLSPYIANQVNEKREEILASIHKRFLDLMTPDDKDKQLMLVEEVHLSNMDYPEALALANADRAVQAVLRDKAIAERERVSAETETAEMRKALQQREGAAVAAKIDEIGASLKRNPEYLQFDLQQKMPDIYKVAGDKGNLILTAPAPQVLVNRK